MVVGEDEEVTIGREVGEWVEIVGDIVSVFGFKEKRELVLSVIGFCCLGNEFIGELH